MKIFIMDDERLICSFLMELLGLEGYLVLSASSVRDATRMIEHEVFDLALIDVHMFDGNGLEVIRAIKMRRPVVRIIGMSGSAPKDSCIAAGADDFIEKPFTDRQLMKVISGV